MDIETLWNSLGDKSELTEVIATQKFCIEQFAAHHRFQLEVLREVLELADEKSKTPLQNIGMIRVKAQVALRAAAKSGLLS